MRPSPVRLSVRLSVNNFSKRYSSYNFSLISILLGTQVDYTKIHKIVHRFLISMNGVAMVTKNRIFFEIPLKRYSSYNFDLISILLCTQVDYTKIHKIVHWFLISVNDVAMVTKNRIFFQVPLKRYSSYSFDLISILLGTQVDYTKIH